MGGNEMIAVVYWSGTGNTESMAQAVAKGAGDAKLVNADNLGDFDVDGYEKLAFGCPSMGMEQLEESVFEPFFAGIEANLADKKVVLFGSYGWGDCSWMRDWEVRVKASGATLLADGLTINEAPDADGLAACEALGQTLANG